VPLAALGKVHLTFTFLALGAAVWLWWRVRGGSFARVVTWDCGYAAPTARMQYTAGSFAGLITDWFAWILRPVRHEHRPEEMLPASANYSQHTPETVLEYAVEPAGGMVMQLSKAARRLQHGRVQTYLLYLLIGLAALGLVVLIGADQ
jgi:hydrogenase-4 component B